MFSVSFSEQSGYAYWMFLSQSPTLNSINWNNLADGRALQDVHSPTTVCNQPIYSIHGVTYAVLNGGPPTFVTLNARTGTAQGGAGSPLVTGQARASGSVWGASAQVPASLRSVGYAPVTGCGAQGRPPSGRFVAVGQGGSIYYADWQPLIAGQPVRPDQALAWSAIAPPSGFSGTLNGVAMRLVGVNTAGVAVIRYAAIGDAGAILVSNDGAGQIWSLAGSGATNQNLNSITSGGSALYVAVGDAGAIVATSDGANWFAQGLGVTQANLHAVRCAGASCLAMGDGASLLATGNGGSNWVQTSVTGYGNWRALAYGNANANADYASVSNGTFTINTWVAGDDQGNLAFSTNGGATWSAANLAGVGAIVGIEYTSRFVAVDSVGNAYASEDGRYWAPTATTGLTAPVTLVGTGDGFMAADATGATSISY